MNHRLLGDHAFAVLNRIREPRGLPGFRSQPLVPRGLEKETHLLPLLLLVHDAETSIAARVSLSERLAVMSPAGSKPLETEPPVLMLLATCATADQIQVHLTRHVIAHLPGHGNTILRWHDPEVFVHLLNDLQGDQLRSLFGPVERITFLWHGTWYTASAPASTEPPRWMFDAADTARLADIALVNAVLAAIDCRDLADMPALSRQIRSAIERGRSGCGLSRPEDLTAFATQALRIHPQFDRHFLMQTLLAGLGTTQDDDNQDPQTFADAAALLPDSVWRQIKDDVQANWSANL